MENSNKKYSITLDRSVYESNDLNELEKLAIDYCINIDEYDCFDTKDGDVIKISSIEKHDWEAEGIYSLIYDNLIEIDVNITALESKDWEYLFSELTKTKFRDSSWIKNLSDQIISEELDLIIYLPNRYYNRSIDHYVFAIDKYFDDGMYDEREPKTFVNLVELINEINNLKK